MNSSLIEIHPGEILREELMVPLGLSESALIGALDVPPEEVSALLAETGPITTTLAHALAVHFKTSVGFWMNLQSAYDKRMTGIGGRQ